MKLKQLTASLLSICMITTLFMTSFASTAFAAGATGGKDLIVSNTPATTGMSILGKKFNIYEIFSATINKDDPTDAKAVNESLDYTIHPDFVDFFAANATGFVYPDVTDTDTYPLGAEDPAYKDDMNVAIQAARDFIEQYNHHPEADGTKPDGVVGTMEDLVKLLRAYVFETDLTQTLITTNSAVRVNSKEEAQTTNAGLLGYYLVLDSEDTEPATADQNTVVLPGMLCNLPARGNTGALDQNQTITVKGSAPTIGKEIWHNDENKWDEVGDFEMGDVNKPVKFRVTATLPSNLTGYTSENHTYIIEDVMSNGLALVPGSIKIYLDPDMTQEAAGYNHVEWDAMRDPSYYKDNEVTRVFTYKFNVLGILEALPGLEKFYIGYEAIVEDSAKLSTEGYETNNVELTYSNNPYDTSSTSKVDDTVYSYTFDLDVTKTSGDGVTPLAGAEFQLFRTTGESTNTAVWFNITVDDNGNSIYAVTHAPDANSTQTIITNNTGKFNIVGLDDQVTYKLVETQAPADFNPADDLIFTITVEYANEDITGVPVIKTINAGNVIGNTDNNLSTTIINTSKALLPSTGGVGTTMFTVGGISLMLGAAVLMIIKRKKS